MSEITSEIILRSKTEIPHEIAEQAAEHLTENLSPDKFLEALIRKSDKYGAKKDSRNPDTGKLETELTPTHLGASLSKNLAQVALDSVVILDALLDQVDATRSSNTGQIDSSWTGWQNQLDITSEQAVSILVDELQEAYTSNTFSPKVDGYPTKYRGSTPRAIIGLSGVTFGDAFSASSSQINFETSFGKATHPALVAISGLRKNQGKTSVTSPDEIKLDLGIKSDFGRS